MPRATGRRSGRPAKGCRRSAWGERNRLLSRGLCWCFTRAIAERQRRRQPLGSLVLRTLGMAMRGERVVRVAVSEGGWPAGGGRKALEILSASLVWADRAGEGFTWETPERDRAGN